MSENTFIAQLWQDYGPNWRILGRFRPEHIAAHQEAIPLVEQLDMLTAASENALISLRIIPPELIETAFDDDGISDPSNLGRIAAYGMRRWPVFGGLETDGSLAQRAASVVDQNALTMSAAYNSITILSSTDTGSDGVDTLGIALSLGKRQLAQLSATIPILQGQQENLLKFGGDTPREKLLQGLYLLASGAIGKIAAAAPSLLAFREQQIRTYVTDFWQNFVTIEPAEEDGDSTNIFEQISHILQADLNEVRAELSDMSPFMAGFAAAASSGAAGDKMVELDREVFDLGRRIGTMVLASGIERILAEQDLEIGPIIYTACDYFLTKSNRYDATKARAQDQIIQSMSEAVALYAQLITRLPQLSGLDLRSGRILLDIDDDREASEAVAAITESLTQHMLRTNTRLTLSDVFNNAPDIEVRNI